MFIHTYMCIHTSKYAYMYSVYIHTHQNVYIIQTDWSQLYIVLQLITEKKLTIFLHRALS